MTGTVLPVLVALIAFLAMMLMSMGVLGVFSGAGRSRKLARRIGGPAVAVPGAPMARPRDDRWIEDMARSLGEKLAAGDSEEMSKTRAALIQAGIRGVGAPAVFQGTKAALAVGLACLFLLIRFAALPHLPLVWTLFFTVLLAGLGCYLPDAWLRHRIAGRKLAILNELPDALDLLVVCVEAGMGLDQAIQRVSHETRYSGPVVSRELIQVTLELRAGKQRQEALRSLASRVGLEDVTSLATLLIQADLFGISVAKTLRVYSDTLRTKRFQRAEELAAKLPVKLLLPLVFFILPALFVAIMGPAGIKLMDVFARMNH